MPTVASTVELVVHCELLRSGRRRVVEVLAPTGALSAPVVEGGVVEASRLFGLVDGALRPVGGLPPRPAKYRAAGIEPGELMRAPA